MMVSGHDYFMTNEQAHDMVLAWCRSAVSQLNGRRPAMRSITAMGSLPAHHRVIDVSFIDINDDAAILAVGIDWIEVCAALGVYGPQWEPAPKPIKVQSLRALNANVRSRGGWRRR